MAKIAERPQVADDGKVPKVPQQFAPKRCPLLWNWFMPVLPTPFRDALESAPKAVCGSLLLHHPKSLAGHGPVMGETQQVESAGPGASIAVIVVRCSPVRPFEIN